MNKIYLTKDGFEKLKKELEYLKTVKRKEIAKQLELARSFGDLRENSEYEAAKHELSLNEIKIKELEDKLSRAEIIEQKQRDTGGKIFIGSKVTLYDLEFEEEVVYELTGSEEADPAKGKISVESPVGKALLSRSVNETVEIKAPKGVLRYKILDVT
ncbi:MAG: transcription elongation factor GreA [Chitinispirillaceae bacterium]|nr:transcription elongation factor GreA [Chitinispirillaceae bacterium]